MTSKQSWYAARRVCAVSREWKARRCSSRTLPKATPKAIAIPRCMLWSPEPIRRSAVGSVHMMAVSLAEKIMPKAPRWRSIVSRRSAAVSRSAIVLILTNRLSVAKQYISTANNARPIHTRRCGATRSERRPATRPITPMTRAPGARMMPACIGVKSKTICTINATRKLAPIKPAL